MSENEKVKQHQNSYTVAFKMKVVNEVENGLISVRGASRLYEIPHTTVLSWIKRYGLGSKIDKVVCIMTNEDQREMLRLRLENERLTKALDDSHLKNLALESLLEIAEETYGVDLKKNSGSRLAEELRKKLMLSDLKDLE